MDCNKKETKSKYSAIIPVIVDFDKKKYDLISFHIILFIIKSIY